MAAHRYWRAVGLEAYGESLEITEFQLLGAGVRVDAPATLTANIAPASGSVGNLKDDDLSTGARWAGADLPALVLSWDFGGGGSADVTDIRVGSASDATRFLLAGKLQYSDNATSWADAWTPFAGVAWPGPRAKTSSETIGAWNRGFKIDTDLSASGSIATLRTVSGSPRAATALRSSGVLQVEFEWINVSLAGATAALGVMGPTTLNSNTSIGNNADSWVYLNNGQKRVSSVGTAYGATYTLADVIGLVVDFSAGSLTFYKNGVSQGVAYTGLSFTELNAAAQMYNTGSAWQVRARTKGFTYPVAGATPWEERDTSITQTVVRGKTRTAAVGTSPSALSVPMPFQLRYVPVYQTRGDYITGVLGRGVGRVKGTTKDKGTPNVPVSERVRLYREQDGLLLRETWSAPGTGAYSFDYVDELQTFTVLSYDHDKNFRAVVADGLTLAGGGVELIEAAVVVPVELRVRGVQPITELPSGTSIVLPLPSFLDGDLLVAVVMVRSTASTPAGWTLQSSSGVSTAGGTNQQTHVYTRVATLSEPGSYSFTQASTGRMNGQILSLASPNGTPVFNVENHATTSNITDTTITIPTTTAISPGVKNQIAVGALSMLGGLADATQAFPAGWTNVVRPTSATQDNRLAVAYKRLVTGEALSGAAKGTDGGPGNAVTLNVLIFTDP